MKLGRNTMYRGTTMVEAILYVAIFSMLVVGFMSFLGSMRSTRLHNQAMLEVNDQGSAVIRTITRALRDGRSITTPAVGVSGTTLTLTTVNPSTNPTIFSLTSGVLTMKEGTGPPIPLTNNKVTVSNLSFSNLSRPNTPGIIRIRMTMANGPESQRSEESFSQNFYGTAATR